MLAKEMILTKIKCRKCNHSSLSCGIGKTISVHEIYPKQIKPNFDAYVYTKRVGGKTNRNKKDRNIQSKIPDQRNTFHLFTFKSAN